MKIVIASGIYPPDIGGPATYSQLIARELTKRGIEVSLICYSDKRRYTQIVSEQRSEYADTRGKFQRKSAYPEGQDQRVSANFKVVRILRKHNVLLRYWNYFWNLLKLVKGADAIYAQGPLAAGFPALLVSKILRKKFVVKIVGDYAWEQFQNKKSKIKNKKFIDIETFQRNKYDFLTELRRKIQKLVVKSADKIIVPSKFLKKIVIGWGVREDKIFVVYNAASGVENVEEKLNPEGDIIISGGRLEPWKGMDVLIEIMPDLLKENPNFRLIIVGYGPEKENLKSQISNLKLEDKIELIDKLSHKELLEYFKASKMFVLNTGYEGFSHFLLETMAIGLPVITTNICGNPEIVKDGYNGLLIEYNNKEQLKDTILRLWEDKKLREKFIENGKKTTEQFTLEKMINETLSVLEI